MASANERTRTEQKFEFTITHEDVVAMMNDPEVLLNGGDVSEDQVFSMALRKSNGTEILLRDLRPDDTLVFRFGVVTVTNEGDDFTDINIS